MTIINGIGWVIYAYLVIAVWAAPTAPEHGIWKRISYTIANMTWLFWLLLVVSTCCIGYVG